MEIMKAHIILKIKDDLKGQVKSHKLPSIHTIKKRFLQKMKYDLKG